MVLVLGHLIVPNDVPHLLHNFISFFEFQKGLVNLCLEACMISYLLAKSSSVTVGS